jgi:hypothetical protein
MSTDNEVLIREAFEAFLAGDMGDGRPGPNAEMHLTDPDGYVLMVAQINEADDARGD